jgi:hypothetical protein
MPSFMEDAAHDVFEIASSITDMIISQMMFVSGETVEPSPETTTLVEQIVQQQVMEMVGYQLFLILTYFNSHDHSYGTAQRSQHVAATAASRLTI